MARNTLAQVEPQALPIVCAWCGVEMRAGNGPVSHGMCQPCAVRWLKDAEAEQVPPKVTTDRVKVLRALRSPEWQLPSEVAAKIGISASEARVICELLSSLGLISRHGGYPDFRYRTLGTYEGEYAYVNRRHRDFSERLIAAVRG